MDRFRHTATTPEGHELVLVGHDGGFVIRFDGFELMSSLAHGSEDELGRLGCLPFASAARPRVLVAGLGMGYTLRSALDVLPAGAEVRVVELLAAVVDWNRGALAVLAGAPLDDRRVTVVVRDVMCELETASPGVWDAILLDVDNGPSCPTLAGNRELYGAKGLALARRALAPSGVLAVWSTRHERDFLRRLEASGYRARSVAVPPRPAERRTNHVIVLATPR